MKHAALDAPALALAVLLIILVSTSAIDAQDGVVGRIDEAEATIETGLREIRNVRQMERSRGLKNLQIRRLCGNIADSVNEISSLLVKQKEAYPEDAADYDELIGEYKDIGASCVAKWSIPVLDGAPGDDPPDGGAVAEGRPTGGNAPRQRQSGAPGPTLVISSSPNLEDGKLKGSVNTPDGDPTDPDDYEVRLLNTTQKTRIDDDGAFEFDRDAGLPVYTVRLYKLGKPVAVASAPISGLPRPEDSGPFGVAMAGVVISNQNQNFNQADPFAGFQVGYGSRVFGIKKDIFENLDVPVGTDCTGVSLTGLTERNFRYASISFGNRTLVRVSDDVYTDGLCSIAIKKDPFRSRRSFRVSVRFQGLFSAEGRAATAVSTEEPPKPEGSKTPAPETFKFIDAEQTFSPELTLWVEFQPLRYFTYGLYGTYGASTGLYRNPARERLVSNDSTNEQTLAVTTVDTDAKRYYEFGAMSHIKLSQDKYFAQAFLGYGNYEALSGLLLKSPATDSSPAIFDTGTRNRFIGKIRIFPTGFNPFFKKQTTIAPMFGVDINAGRGPDYFRFFSGFVVNIPENLGTLFK